MSADFDFLIPYCSGARASSSSSVFIVVFPSFLCWRLASISNRFIGMSCRGMKLSSSLCMSRYRPLRYLFG